MERFEDTALKTKIGFNLHFQTTVGKGFK